MLTLSRILAGERYQLVKPGAFRGQNVETLLFVFLSGGSADRPDDLLLALKVLINGFGADPQVLSNVINGKFPEAVLLNLFPGGAYNSLSHFHDVSPENITF
jgi:hypothetical protein